MTSYTTETVHVKPVRELRLTRQGALLASGRARYDDLDAYIYQFGAPLSQLPGAGALTFADPIEAMVLLVECRDIDWCH